MQTGCWLVAVGDWLLAIGYWLLAIGYWLLAGGWWLVAIDWWLVAGGYETHRYFTGVLSGLAKSEAFCKRTPPARSTV